MSRRIQVSLFLATSLLASVFTTAVPLQAQTRPRIQVPTEDASQAQAIVQKLLDEGRIIRSSEVKRGMKGFGRSVFQGTEIEEFPIEVIGVLERVQGGADIVLIRVTGGTVVKRNSGIVAGMSGSPVYINGKMLGAIALGWGFPKEPIGGVTPITEMIRTSLPDTVRREVVRPEGQPSTPANNAALPSTPWSTRSGEKTVYQPKQPLTLAGKEIKRVVVSRDKTRLALSGSRENATMTMRPATTLLQISGMREQSLPLLRRIFEPYQLEPVIGPASQKNVPSPPIKPGSAMGVQLVSGDMDQTAVGTVTFRWGDRILGFGHPMFGQGPASIPLASSFVHDIFPSYQRSFKLASPIKVVGAMQQDTQFAVGGTLGALADTIPMSVSLHDPARGIRRTFNVKVMKDPVLTPQLIGMVASEAIETTLGLTSDKTVRVGMTMEIDGAPAIVRSNLLYTQGPVTPAAIADLRQTLLITQSNEFARGSISRVALSVSIDDSRRIATIKNLVANRNKVRAGETVRFNVQLEPLTTPNQYITKTFEVKVPEDAPDGIMRVVAAPGAAFWGGQVRAGGAPPEPSSLRELVDAWNKVGAFNELLLQVSTSQTFLQINDKKLPNPPPSWGALLRSSRSTGVAAYNEVETQRVFTEMALSGAQFLSIPIESVGYREGNGEEESTAVIIETEAPADSKQSDEDNPSPTGQPSDAVPSSQAMLLNGIMPLTGQDDWIVKLTDAPQPAFARPLLPMQTGVVPGRERSDRPVAPALISPTPTPKPTATSTPKPTPTPTAKPTSQVLARPAQSWVQGSAADFLKGQIEAAVITNQGDVRPAPPSTLLATTAEPFIWSIASDNDNNVYLGTSNPARILKINGDGQQSVFYEGNEVTVNALTSDKNGNLYAGLSPGGRVLRFDAKGRATTILDTDDTFVWALAWDANGHLLATTGGEKGHLYRIANAATTSTAVAQSIASVPQNHIRSLAVRGNEIFLGTGDEGVLWRLDENNALQALFQVPAKKSSTVRTATGSTLTTTTSAMGSEILALAAAPEGVYFGTSGKGTLYRWHDDNVEELYHAPQQSVYALQRTADGTLYMATGNGGIVYQIQPGKTPSDTRAARLLEPSQIQALALALTADQKALLVGTGNNGAAHRIALNSENSGLFTSPVFDAQNIVRWGALRLIGNGVAVETRSGNTQEPDASWSDWRSAGSTAMGELQTASSASRYLQYRARLGAPADDPHLSRVEVVYRARNNAPQVAWQGTPGGSYWSGKETIKWTGTDPDKDTLQYRLWIAEVGQADWKEVDLEKKTTASFILDTTKWPDGNYRLKIAGSDAERNPEDPLQAEDISQPLTIDNSEPVVASSALEKVGADGSLRLRLTATDIFSPLAGAEWRWKAAESTPDEEEEEEETDEADDTAETADEAIAKAATAATKAAVATPLTGDKSADSKEDKKEAKKTEYEWHATAATDGIFDTRREEIVALLPPVSSANKAAVEKDKEAITLPPLPTAIEVRIHDSAGNSKIQVIALP